MIRTWQTRLMRLSSGNSDEQMEVRCHFDDEPGTIDTFYVNIFRLAKEEGIPIDVASEAMKRLLLDLV
jgi:hypothetical protein